LYGGAGGAGTLNQTTGGAQGVVVFTYVSTGITLSIGPGWSMGSGFATS
jgi:hypothetical protein